MATIEKVKRRRGGTAFVVSFYRGARYKISLPSCFTLSDARALASAVDEILRSEKRGVEPRVQSYLDAAPPLILKKLSAVGLVDVRALETLDEAAARYFDDIEARLKSTTVSSIRAIFKRLRPFLDFSLTPDELTPERASEAILGATQGTAPSYARQILTSVKSFYAFVAPASANPFNSVVLPTARKLAGRDFNVPSEWTDGILDACPSQEWRVAFVLWRFGGLRFKEAFRLTWDDVLFERRRLVVHCEKTARYGKDLRVVPLFPEIEREIDALFLETSEPELLPTLTASKARRDLDAIITRAGYTPWARPFQNLRATRENELVAAGFPAHVVAEWLGHSSAVQSRYYLRVLDSYYDMATGGRRVDENVGDPLKNGRKLDAR